MNVIALILLVPLTLAGCTPRPASGIQSVSNVQSAGVLEGSVTKGPLFPMARPGMPSASGVPGARIDIATIDGKPVITVETDSAGTFRVNLPVGTYKVTMPSLYGAMFTKDLPAVVTIVSGQEQRLDIHLDTGIR